MANIIDKYLLEEIKLKQEKIAGNPEFYDQRRDLVIQSIRSMGDVYSFWIENPDLRKSLLLQNKSEKNLRKLSRKGIQAVHNAWYFLSKIGEHGNFIGNLNSDLLKRVNGLINETKSREFRKGSVGLNILGYTPPNQIKVPEKVKRSMSQVKQRYSFNPLEAGIMAHLDITAIQPFDEGNKRTARIIQDRILYDAGLPPAIISAGEAIFYRRILNEVLPAYGEGDIDGQKIFYNYCASKVNAGLDEILGDLVEEPAKF
jgi:hypothetical protein